MQAVCGPPKADEPRTAAAAAAAFLISIFREETDWIKEVSCCDHDGRIYFVVSIFLRDKLVYYII